MAFWTRGKEGSGKHRARQMLYQTGLEVIETADLNGGYLLALLQDGDRQRPALLVGDRLRDGLWPLVVKRAILHFRLDPERRLPSLDLDQFRARILAKKEQELARLDSVGMDFPDDDVDPFSGRNPI